MKELAYLNQYLYKYRWRLLLGILFISLSNYFRVLQPQMIREALDLVVGNINLFRIMEGFELRQAFVRPLGKSLLLFGAVVMTLAILMGIFMFFMRQTIVVMSRLVEYDLRKEIYGHYQKLDLAFYRRHNTGDLMARITEDVSKVRMYIGPAMLYGINLVTLFVMVIYSMFQVSTELSLYSLLPLPVLSISIYYVSNLINKKSEIIQKQLAQLNSISQEVYSGIRVVKSYVQEKPMAGHFEEQCQDYKNKSLDLAQVNAFFYPLMVLMIGLSTIITVYIGGYQVAKGNISAGNIAEFVIYINMLTWPVTAIGWIASLIQQASASQKRINEFLQTPPGIANEGRIEGPLRGEVEFRKVAFTYPQTGIQALNGVNFHLQPGQKLAILGKTGSGKSTIGDLLLRLYDLTDGEILIDGKGIREHDLSSLRHRIGYVPQDVFLFSDSIHNNISFGATGEVDRETVEKFARYAAIYEDIKALPEGFDTIIGERGVTLSGGQKQRVSIARALIKEPDILILDDCLSAVDTQTEKQILSYFNEYLQDKTAIIITHRIYAYLQFDQIIVLDNGRITEMGTHEQLLQNKGYYYELFENQSREESVPSSVENKG